MSKQFINFTKEKGQELLNYIRRESDPKETVRRWERRYGYEFSSAHYYKEDRDLAIVFRTNGIIDHIIFYDLLPPE